MLCIIVVIVTSSQVPTIPTVVQGGIQPPSMIGMHAHSVKSWYHVLTFYYNRTSE